MYLDDMKFNLQRFYNDGEGDPEPGNDDPEQTGDDSPEDPVGDPPASNDPEPSGDDSPDEPTGDDSPDEPTGGNDDPVIDPYALEEPLGLIPNGTRTRFPIAWNGKGRYVAGTLQIVDNRTNQTLSGDTFSEEDNGIFFNFTTAPTGEYTDYTVKYTVNEDDYKFSTGADNTVSGEEYFLFPNWMNFEGCGDAFWVGKYVASRTDATPTSKGVATSAQTKKGLSPITDITFGEALAFAENKGEKFHIMRNREWTNIAYWMDMFEMKAEGNMQSYADPAVFGHNLDGIYDQANNNRTTLPGLGPVNWRHNLRTDGIADLIGNLWEMIDGVKIDYRGLEQEHSGVFVFNENNEYPAELTDQTCLIKLPDDIDTIDFNVDQMYAGYENPEGLPLRLTTSLYYVPRKDWSNPEEINSMSAVADPTRPYNARRMGYMFTDKTVSMWYIGIHDTETSHSWSDGFRLCASLED